MDLMSFVSFVSFVSFSKKKPAGEASGLLCLLYALPLARGCINRN
jgi:hypothetical protein